MASTQGLSLSEEDLSLIETSQTGTPLGLYTIKPVIPLLVGYVGMCFLACGLIIGADTLITGIRGLQQAHAGDALLSALLIGLAIFCFLCGLFLLSIEAPGIRRRRVIVCAQGLIQIDNTYRDKHIDVARWSDIVAIKKKCLALIHTPSII